MTKSELIKRLVERHANLYQKDVHAVIDIIFKELATALRDGNRVELRGFGAFSVRQRAARKARNPRTNEKILLSERNVPYFRAGKELKERVNRS